MADHVPMTGHLAMPPQAAMRGTTSEQLTAIQRFTMREPQQLLTAPQAEEQDNAAIEPTTSGNNAVVASCHERQQLPLDHQAAEQDNVAIEPSAFGNNAFDEFWHGHQQFAGTRPAAEQDNAPTALNPPGNNAEILGYSWLTWLWPGFLVVLFLPFVYKDYGSTLCIGVKPQASALPAAVLTATALPTVPEICSSIQRYGDVGNNSVLAEESTGTVYVMTREQATILDTILGHRVVEEIGVFYKFAGKMLTINSEADVVLGAVRPGPLDGDSLERCSFQEIWRRGDPPMLVGFPDFKVDESLGKIDSKE